MRERCMLRAAIGRFQPPTFQDRADLLSMLGHKQGQGLEGVFSNVDLSRLQKGVELLGDVEHFVMGLCLFPGAKDHIFFSMRYDNIFYDNSHAVLSPVSVVYVAL